MSLDQGLQAYIAESRELLEDMENALLSLEHAEATEEIINEIFRAAHTIKGSAGLFGLDDIIAFTHDAESVLDHVRDGELKIADQLLVLLLSCCDHIALLLDAIESGKSGLDAAAAQRGAQITAQLQTFLNTQSPAEMPVALPEPDTDRMERIDGESVDNEHWHISLRFGPDVLRNGMDPLSFLRYLGTLGTIAGVLTLPDGVPPAEQMDPEACYLGFEIVFKSDAEKAEIESVFDFVRDDCLVRILPPQSRISEYIRLIQDMPAESARLGELLLRCGTLTAHELETALAIQSGDTAAPKLGEILVDQGAVQPAVVEAALAKQEQVKLFKTQESRSVRVDADKLDHLINLVGELIIAAASANLAARRAQNADLNETTSTLAGLVEDVRESALQLRMVKIGATFSRFQRVVHDVSREIGKDIALMISGEDTELDKTVVEKITDPLTHLVRNAIDHGIEPAELRTARGKPVRGTVRLNAYHDSGSIVIEVGDDGGGLDRDRILAKAVECGLIEPGRNLSDSEVHNLIFEPGFSTAEQVTNLSGRGVGMDVVKRNIVALRGNVSVKSEPGIGTTVMVRLPLTLAIINGFLVEIGTSVFVIPLDMIEECLAFSAEPGHDFTNLRGQVLPFIRLRDQFGIAGAAVRRESIVVVQYGGIRAGLVVDKLLGEFQTVIKPLAKMFNQVKCISGSTILGSGEVALILDVPALLQRAGHSSTAAARPSESVLLSAQSA